MMDLSHEQHPHRSHGPLADLATYRSRILDAVEFVITDGIRAWGTIEPLAGLFFPRVKAEIQAELRLRGLDPWTGGA